MNIGGQNKNNLQKNISFEEKYVQFMKNLKILRQEHRQLVLKVKKAIDQKKLHDTLDKIIKIKD